MRTISPRLIAFAFFSGALTFGAQAAEVDKSGSAALGAKLSEMGQTVSGGSIYVAHGYAAVEIKPAVGGRRDMQTPDTGQGAGVAAGDVATTGSVATSTGELVFRIRDFCVADADAQVIPLGLMPSAAGTTGAAPTFFVTGVKVDLSDQQQESCMTSVKVTYGINLPPNATLTQVGYTVYLTGKKRTPDSKPAILPRIGL